MMTGILIFTIFTLTIAVLGGYTIVAPWWRTRAGKAYFILFCSLALLAGFFLVEALVGELDEWVKDVVLALVAAAIAWNLYTIISKQLYYWRREHPTARPDLTDPQI